MSADTRQTTASQTPLWRDDASERFRMLLPELVVSVVMATCFACVVAGTDEAFTARYLMCAAFAQVLALTTLYACTYLSDNDRIISLGWLLVALGCGFVTPLLGAFADSATDSYYLTLISPMLSLTLFYLTRARWSFVLTAIEVLSLSESVEPNDLGPVHLVGIVALTVLFVIRSSAARITMGPWRAALVVESHDGEVSRGALGTYEQILLTASVTGALCLMVALGGFALMSRARSMHTATSEQQVQTAPEEPTESHGTTGPATTETPEGELGEDAAPGEQAEKPADGSPATNEPTASDDIAEGEPQADPHPAQQTTPHKDRRFPLVPLLLAALLAALLCARPLVRTLFSRTHATSRPADRVARLYLDTLARLCDMGIERQQQDTPREFLEAHADELAELTAPAGLSLDAWETLTAAYEKARYADLDPTEDELAACQQLYAALPSCTRATLSWPRALLQALRRALRG